MSNEYSPFISREQALAEIVDTAGLGLWKITVNSASAKAGSVAEGVIRFDDRCRRILGLPDQGHELDLEMNLDEVAAFYHEEDRARVRASTLKLLAEPGASNSIEYRIRSQAEGGWQWVRSFCKSFADAETGGVYIWGCIQQLQDGRAFRSILDQVRAANERSQIMLDATPLCCNFWDENYNNIDCNQEAVKLFDLRDKREYLDNFHRLSPEYQPDGQLSADKALVKIREAFDQGRAVFEWMHQKLDGEPIPSEITLVRVRRGEGDIVLGYTRDLREYKRMMAEMREADERTKIMLDATPCAATSGTKIPTTSTAIRRRPTSSTWPASRSTWTTSTGSPRNFSPTASGPRTRP